MRKLVVVIWGTVLAAVAYFLITQDINISLGELPHFLKEQISSLGYWSVLAFVLFGLLRPILLVPTSAMLILGALLFGFMGIVYGLLSEFLSSTVAFYVSRYIGHDFIENHTGERFKNFEHKLEDHSFKSIILLRLMLFVPNDLVNYAAGASNMQYQSFIVASLVGTLPKAILYNYSTAGLSDVRYLIIPATILFGSIICEKTIKYAYVRHKNKQLKVIAELGEVAA